MLEEKNISVGGAGSAPERGTSEELPDARTLLRAFVRERLDGDLRNFREFDFEALKGDERFGCADPRKFDGDNTFIIRAVYVLLFGKAFPDMTDWRGIGSGMRYRGDTIHTFHTVFGRADPDRPEHFFGIDRFAPVGDELYERIRHFRCKVCNLGNYVVLPNVAVEENDRFVTMNTYRGTNRWRDYFDQFLLALESCLSHDPDADQTLCRLVRENAPAFAAYEGRGGFARFAGNLLLDDYLDAEGHARNLFADADGEVRFHWENPQPPRELYLRGVTNYLDHAERIIARRADRMVEMLKAFC